MRELWIMVCGSWSKEIKLSLIKGTAEYCDGYILEPEDTPLAREAGAKKVASKEKGDLLLVNSVEEAVDAKRRGTPTMVVIEVVKAEDIQSVIDYVDASTDYIVVRCGDWKVIPIENLIAQTHMRSKLLAYVSGVEGAKLMLEALELGVDGVITEESDPERLEPLRQIVESVRTRRDEIEEAKKLSLLTAEIVETRPLGSGARVCVDTCDLMIEGEGMLVGCQSSGLFLVQAEVLETPYVSPRPFRVNAGPAAQYILAPGDKTGYLSELKAGEEVMIVDRRGATRSSNVCRVKVEWRPLMLIEAECEGKRLKVILQNAETIRLVTPKGHRSVVELKAGDEVLVHIEEGGRHFGTLVEEEKVIEA